MNKRLLRAAALAFSAMLAVSALPARVQAADRTVLATGFAEAKKLGYSDHGWSGHYLDTFSGGGYWGQLAGHNCTGYVAYVLSQYGMANPAYPKNPAKVGNLGNAGDWETNAKKLGYAVDDIPAVGSVAQNPGHVMYVEAVAEDGTWFLASEDNWLGDFRWVRVTKTKGGWGYKFIHFKDLQPTTLPEGDGWYIIQHKGKTEPKSGNPLCVDVAGWTQEPGEHIQQHEYWVNGGAPQAGGNQKFYFELLGDGTYKIKTFANDARMALDVNEIRDEARVTQLEWHKDGWDHGGQHWRVYSDLEGYYKIVNNWSGKCLDIQGNSDRNHAAAQTYHDNATAAQRFRLIKQ